MLLVVDYRSGHGSVLVGEGQRSHRYSTGRRDGFDALAKSLEELAGRRPDGAAVVLPQDGQSGRPVGLTWSAVRGAVAMGNALAFAWNVPAVRIDPSDDDRELLDSAREALRGAGPEAIVKAEYEAPPNITRPKNGS